MLYQVRTWGPTLVGVHVAGLLIGSRMSGSSALWWLVIALGVFAILLGLLPLAVERARGTQPKPLAKV